MFELAIFTKGFILFRCLTRTSSDNCFCTISILYVWHGFNRLNIFPKSSSWDIRHRLHPLVTFAKSFILDVRHRFYPLTVFVKCSIIDVWQGFNPLIISSKDTSLDVWHELHPLTTFAKCLHLRCLTRIPSVICFRKRLHSRCSVLDILRSQRDNKLTVNYVNYFYEKCMKITRNKWNLTTLMKSL